MGTLRAGEKEWSYHGCHELATEPRASTGSDVRFDDGDLEGWSVLSQVECTGETCAASTDDDHVGDRPVVHHIKVSGENIL